eukprot:CAMPEP_0117667492 /NCGR_PEP_ID=MMETSP0804-20121206/11004_1 /TAXON_ID=1074897 /ORGANISM="Tetraselmis astigmatica, Strain CCMP880" /LENGTH=389 /DNA_ID=CAMNT_0005475239 /DNA_START=179 /DNA_END=1351 /DNA_ORIENTATION=+
MHAAGSNVQSLPPHTCAPFPRQSLSRASPSPPPPHKIFPTNGLQSCSYWDVEQVEQLQAWLDEFLGDDCINTISEVQEDFAWGIGAPLSTARGAEAVSARSAALAKSVSQRAHEVTGAATVKLGELDEKYHISNQASSTFTAARERTAGATKAIGNVADRAMQNQKVASAVSGVGVASSAAWKRMGMGYGFLKNKLGEISDTVAASVQEYNKADTLQGVSTPTGSGTIDTSGMASPALQPPSPPEEPPKEPAFAGFDEISEPEAPPPPPPPAATPSAPATQPPAPQPVPAYTIDDDSTELDAKGIQEDDDQALTSSMDALMRLSDDEVPAVAPEAPAVELASEEEAVAVVADEEVPAATEPAEAPAQGLDDLSAFLAEEEATKEATPAE